MEFKVEKKVLDAGVKILFVVIEGLDNSQDSQEWLSYRKNKIAELYQKYGGIDVHADPILEGFNILHDKTGVRRRKNIPASENLIKLLEKHSNLLYINKVVDIYNLISLESELALGAHNIDHVDGNVTLRFTRGDEKYIPLGQTEPQPVKPHEYSYIDDSNEILCRLEIRQVEKTLVDKSTTNVFYIVQGNEATPDSLVKQTAQQIIDTTVKFCGGKGKIIVPEVI
ncbi:phenylalanine--tRNA ligase beta subunit-related protein [Prevotella cerevisiae]|uniref:Phenylalanine--tRNA ligase beta subunit-related protein n=1 Tax=Segatella cerevisiae TaxID=2053716 RepID=A0ABT1BW40_9BACT|nr:phenylalanine--tRNA ligase beta subunit-related protein [Segatella cerevisiae]MCO6024920.1 phenylalanine--tRNA ligase beta subunit-related protein [Segatella cerevisiae]